MVSDPAPRPQRVDPDDLLAYAQAVARHFHEDDREEEAEPWVRAFSTGYRAWAVRAAQRIVGNLGVIETDLSLPGGTRLPVAAVTAVGVEQTWRRRGLLRSMMAAALDEAVAHGEPVAALFASESPIYGRFGFGPAAPTMAYDIQRVRTGFRDPVDLRLVRSVPPEQAMAGWPAIHAAMGEQRGGSVGIVPGLWRIGLVEDRPGWQGGATSRRLVEVPGRGYARYRVKGGDEDPLPGGHVELIDLLALDAEAECALWQHVCDVDLTTLVRTSLRPPDDALPALVTEPMALGERRGPPLYTRLLDVPRALASRSYATAGRVVLEVDDPDGYAAGCFLLEAGPEGAGCSRTGAAADLALGIEELSAVWLGGTRVVQLAAAGRIAEHRPGAVAALDRLLGVERAPWTTTVF